MIDIINEIKAVHREVGSGRLPAGEAKKIVLRRSYDAEVTDVWDAITNAERISRWFLPVSGDLRLGGRYQLEGNAGGEIVQCEPPRLLKVTWVMGEDQGGASEVEVRLSPGAEGETQLELEHTAVVPAEFWAQFGPGAVGVGWDGTLLGLGMHLRDPGAKIDPSELEKSEEARQFMIESSKAWGVAYEAAGATSAEAAAATENTTNFYVPS